MRGSRAGVAVASAVAAVIAAGLGPGMSAEAAPRARARAAPRASAAARYREAVEARGAGDYARALELIAQGLAIEARNRDLLRLRGEVLLEAREYPRALEAYEAFLAAGPTGAAAREAKKIAEKLRVVKSTFLEITVANGPADVYLNTRTQGVLCRAAPACKQAVLPDRYRVLVERPGFKPWSADGVVVAADQVTPVAVTLIEQPSPLTVRVEPAGARVTVDGAPIGGPAGGPDGAPAGAPAELAPGRHRIAIALAGYAEATRDVEAREGRPIDLAVALTPLCPVRVEPADAEVLLDGAPLAIEGGRAAIPPGGHALLVRAAGYRERRMEIPAERGAGYEIEVALEPAPVAAEPERAGAARGRFTTLRRKLALVAAGAALGAAGGGVALQLGTSASDEGTTRSGDQRRLASQLAYAGAGVAALIAIGLWIDGEPGPARVAITPRRGGAAIDLAVRF